MFFSCISRSAISFFAVCALTARFMTPTGGSTTDASHSLKFFYVFSHLCQQPVSRLWTPAFVALIAGSRSFLHASQVTEGIIFSAARSRSVARCSVVTFHDAFGKSEESTVLSFCIFSSRSSIFRSSSRLGFGLVVTSVATFSLSNVFEPCVIAPA